MRLITEFGWLCAGAVTSLLAGSCADSSHRASGGASAVPNLMASSMPKVAVSSAVITVAASPTISTFVVYAAENVTIGSSDRSAGGDIGVATASGIAPQLTAGAGDALDVLHTLFAPSIAVGRLAVVGAVDTGSLTHRGGLVGAQAAYPSSMPPLPAVFAATPGTSNVTVAPGQVQTLSPGNYDALIDDGTVLLNPGTYSFASVTLGNAAQLQANPGGSTSVRIAGTLATGVLSRVFPIAAPASGLTISVSASDGVNGSPPAVSVGDSSQITALLAVPNGTVSLGDGVLATGAFTGLNFTSGHNVVLTFQSGFASAQPSITTFVAYAELSLSLGTGDHSIGGDIGIAATGTPSAGTQLTVGNLDDLDPSRVLYAPSVSLGNLSVVGAVEANALANGGGISEAQAPYPASAMPPLPLAVPGNTGTTNVTVCAGQVQTLSPGSYGVLSDHGTLLLGSGTYSFASVSLGNSAQLQALPGGSTRVLISGTLATGTFAQIFPVLQPAGAFTISVIGNNGTGGSPPAASIGASSQITALLNVPRGTLSLGDNVLATGAFGGFSLAAGNNVTFAFQSGFPPASQQPTRQQQLVNYVSPVTAATPLVGPASASTSVAFDIGLPLQNFQQLQTIAQEVSNPLSPSYRQFLTQEQFMDSYAPTPADFAALTAFAQASGFAITSTYTSRMLLGLTGTVAQLEQAFYVSINDYQRPDGTIFYAPDRVPSLNLAATVLGIPGIDNYPVPAPSFTVTGPLTSQNVRGAYAGCAPPNLTGTGQTIGIYALGGFDPPTISTYQSTLGMPSPTVVAVPVGGYGGAVSSRVHIHHGHDHAAFLTVFV